MSFTRDTVLWVVGLALLALVPVITNLLDEPFYLDLFRRIMIFAIAALSLNLILGYGGMVSLGHAAYLGIGAYSVGILSFHGIDSGFVQWSLAIGASALVAFIIGAISLRTSGIYFIMITLAFTQMLFFLGVSIEQYGGDDGMSLYSLSQFAGLINLEDANVFYYLVLVILVAFLFLSHRLVNSRFGRVVRGAKSNERRMRAIGFPTYRYKLTMFVISGTMCGVAGALLANQTEYITPDFMHWIKSGEILIMVLFGGLGTLFGPIVGAVAYLLLEDVLSDLTEHWHVILGPALILVVLFGKRGLYGFLMPKERQA